MSRCNSRLLVHLRGSYETDHCNHTIDINTKYITKMHETPQIHILRIIKVFVSISLWGSQKFERIETMKVQLIKFPLQLLSIWPKKVVKSTFHLHSWLFFIDISFIYFNAGHFDCVNCISKGFQSFMQHTLVIDRIIKCVPD